MMNSGQGTMGSALGNGRRALAEEVPVGYKRTEVGVIPEEWNVFSIGDLFDYLRTASNSRADLGDTGIVAYVHYGDIHTRFHHFIDFSRDNVPRLLAGKSVTAARLRDGDLIVADASEDEAGVGKSVEVRNLGTTEAISGLHTFLLRAKGRQVLDGYRGYLLEKESVKGQLRRLATGLKVFGISKQALKEVRIPLPSLSEQCAIAEALSDVDGLLAALEALIAKKQAAKQAAMQQLLTGKSRLPGFSGKWETTTLGEIASIITGNTPPTHNAANYGNEYPFVSPVDLGESKYVVKTEKMLSQKGFAISRRFPADSILFVSIGSTIGKCGIAPTELTSNQQINAVLPSPSFSTDYLYYTICSVAPHIKALAGEQAVPIVNKTQFSETIIPLAPLAEQRAIAAALSDMDAEIAALEQRRDKTRAIKQSMMQQLLTGRVRLIKAD